MTFEPLSPLPEAVPRASHAALARELGDSWRTAAAVHLLRRSICTAWVLRDATGVRNACLIQALPYPAEPFAFGSAEGIWSLARGIPGWSCIHVSQHVGGDLRKRMARELGDRPRLVGDVYFTLRYRLLRHQDPAVRLLTLRDLPLIENAAAHVQGGGFESARAMLAGGTVAGAVVEDRLVALANVSAVTPRFEEVGVATLERHRGNGYATAAASAVVERILERGRTALWSCAEDNGPSRRVAAKLGFERVGRKVYVVPSR